MIDLGTLEWEIRVLKDLMVLGLVDLVIFLIRSLDLPVHVGVVLSKVQTYELLLKSISKMCWMESSTS
tara:strand:+ start:229 stop:432 length:204 start_codon:yes stop_codon:yes gene_type:complete